MEMKPLCLGGQHICLFWLWPCRLGQEGVAAAVLSFWPESGVAQVATWVSHLEPASKDEQWTRVWQKRQVKRHHTSSFSRPALHLAPALVCLLSQHDGSRGFWLD